MYCPFYNNIHCFFFFIFWPAWFKHPFLQSQIQTFRNRIQIAQTKIAQEAQLKVEKKEAADKFTSVEGQTLALVNPLGDIAEEALTERALAKYFTLGSRLAIKHITAIAAAYSTYQMTGGGIGQDFAKLVALAEYFALVKLIENSERADVRYWSTLPQEIRLRNLTLLPGQYRLKVVQGAQELWSEEVIVDEQARNKIYYRKLP